jgi:hypothetical protein
MTTNNSGFLSTFTGHITPAIDILSTVSTVIGGTIDGTSQYTARYFTMGNILVQFTDFIGPTDKFTTGQHTINFPKSFNGKPWCVVATPAVNGQNNAGTLTIRTDPSDISSSNFIVYFDSYSGQIGLTYIAIGPGPPI